MTTVIAVARDGHTVMAADTCTNIYDRPMPGAARKIARLTTPDGDILLAVSGEGALLAVLKTHLTIPANTGDLNDWATLTAHAITTVAREHDCFEDGRLDSNLILAAHGRLWTIAHMQAVPNTDGVAAIGSGEGPAIGAVDALLMDLEDRLIATSDADELRRIVLTAAMIGVARDRYSDLPIDVEELL